MNKFASIAVALFLLSSCGENCGDTTFLLPDVERRLLEELPDPVELDLDSIRKRGKLVALTRYNANSYFVYKGATMGYEYELLKLFAEHMDLELEMRVPATWDSLFTLLNSGIGDLIAANLTVTIPRAKLVDFAKTHTETRQVLVQKKPKGWRKLKKHQLEKMLLRNPLDLVGKKVFVRASSSYWHRLKNLSQEIGGEIIIDKAPEDLETEKIIRMVAEGEIPYTVADANIARINAAYMPDIDVETELSFPQRIAWAVRKTSPDLRKALDEWITTMKKSKDPTYYVIYNKYYKNTRGFRKRQESEFLTLNKGRISPYDSLFRLAEKNSGLDWRLLAAQAYQESRFDPLTTSWAGAIGLMQLLPTTAKRYGLTDLKNVAGNVQAGSSFMRDIQKKWWKDLAPEEALKFTLASYNAGPGHVLDAQRLAKKYGKNPKIWDGNVAEYILKKADEKFYYDPVVRHGYCRGSEPFNYVKEILARYATYSSLVKK